MRALAALRMVWASAVWMAVVEMLATCAQTQARLRTFWGCVEVAGQTVSSIHTG